MSLILKAFLPAWIITGMVFRYVVHVVIVKITHYTWVPYWPSVPPAWEPEEALPRGTFRGGRLLLPLFLTLMAASINLPVGLAQIVQVTAFLLYVHETAHIAFEAFSFHEDKHSSIDFKTLRLAYFFTLTLWPAHAYRIWRDVSRVQSGHEPEFYMLLPLNSALDDSEEEEDGEREENAAS